MIWPLWVIIWIMIIWVFILSMAALAQWNEIFDLKRDIKKLEKRSRKCI